MPKVWLVKQELCFQSLLDLNGNHPTEKTKWALDYDDDWLKLASYWEGRNHDCIPIYMVDLKKPFKVQLIVESIDRSQDSEP